MMSGSISGKCGACRRWVTNGLICKTCNCCFHINCASISPSPTEKNMPWDCMTCNYQKRAKHQEDRIRFLELELKAAREKIQFLKAGNTSSKVKDQENSNDSWIKPQNSKSRARRFSADEVSHIQINNRFSVLEVDQQSPGLLKHVDQEVRSLAKKAKYQEIKTSKIKKLQNQKRKIVLLGSSHGRNIGPMLQEKLGTEYIVTSIFKPNAPLANVIEDLGNLGKDLTKQDHIVIVGGPGNSLDRKYNYSIEEDLNYIAKRTCHINVGLVNLFRRHDKPWMNKKVSSVNIRLDRALLRPSLSHIGVIDTSTIVRDEYTNHGLHLNWRGKRKLTLLIAGKLRDDYVSGISSIPVITHARASPFLG